MPLFLKKKKNLLVLSALLFFQLILISIQVPLREEVSLFEKSFFYAFAPLQHGIASFIQSLKNIWEGYFNLRQAYVNEQKMKEKLFVMLQENNFLKNELHKFKSEQEIQSTIQKIHKNILPARIIGLDASDYYKSVQINKGTSAGVQKNMVVLDKYGNLVGHVVNPIALGEARVQLITDTESGVSIFTQRKQIPGILTGDGKGACFLKYILVTELEVKAGEPVITSGFDGIYPPGIQVGTIVSIGSTNGLFKKIRVKPSFSFNSLDRVAIIKMNSKELF